MVLLTGGEEHAPGVMDPPVKRRGSDPPSTMPACLPASLRSCQGETVAFDGVTNRVLQGGTLMPS